MKLRYLTTLNYCTIKDIENLRDESCYSVTECKRIIEGRVTRLQLLDELSGVWEDVPTVTEYRGEDK